ncbi:hypothetical protein NNC19_18070 [Clostridium sp. SHJSY1]|uniref:hypothetical protein n=1 Tax=Clostridium sp. SHJSY1 TaxID=2942483 RepID=UPI002874EB6F|nr:hypothetical protein [Clostridium sp. SHJSY1]MDS0527600.1 hypothetical protein [Clostridium sp. SHJSY1]
MGNKIGYFTGYKSDFEEKEEFYRWMLNCDEIIMEHDSILNVERNNLTYIMDNLEFGDILAIENFNEISMDIQFVNRYIGKLLEKGIWVISRENDYVSYENENKISIEDIEVNFYTGKIKTSVGRKNKLLPKYSNEVFRRYGNKEVDAKQAMYLLGIKKTKFFEEAKKYDEGIENQL